MTEDEIQKWEKRIEQLETRLKKIQDLVDKQAEDEGIWFIAITVPEAYLQQELRRLHTVIEEMTEETKNDRRGNPKTQG